MNSDPISAPRSWPTWMARALAVPAASAIGAVGVVALALGRVDLSVWGWLWSLGALGLSVTLLGVGAAAVPRWRTALRWLVPLSLLVLVGVRVMTFRGGEHARLVVLDEHGHVASDGRWLDRLFAERDAALVGSRLLVWLSTVPAPEFPTLPELLRRSYPEVERDAPSLGTPIPATLLGLQRPSGFDTIVVEPRGHVTAPSAVGVVFLHGFAGNFALQCLEVARAASALGARTVCPSTSFDGRWSAPAGEATARASIAYLHARGARRIVLVGISAGAIGASRLAPRLHRDIHALVLLSGVSWRAPAPPVPTLVIQGADDTMVHTANVRAWARGRAGVRYRELPGTHFVLLEQRAAVAEELARVIREAGLGD